MRRMGQPPVDWAIVAKLPCHRCYGLGWRPNLAEAAPFVWMLPLSAQHIRGLAVDVNTLFRMGWHTTDSADQPPQSTLLE